MAGIVGMLVNLAIWFGLRVGFVVLLVCISLLPHGFGR